MYPVIHTASGYTEVREKEASEKQCVLLGCSRYNVFTVDAKNHGCESDYTTQRHRKGSVIQMNQELSLEFRFVSLGFPLPFPVLTFY